MKLCLNISSYKVQFIITKFNKIRTNNNGTDKKLIILTESKIYKY